MAKMLQFFTFVSLLACLSHIISGEVVAQELKPKPLNASAICAMNPNLTIVPHEDDCHKFYMCTQNNTREFICADYYYFNKAELRCLLGKCSNDNTVVADQTPCTSTAAQRVDSDCTLFNVCMNGTMRQSHCPPGSYFHVAYASCQPISNNAHHKCSCIMPENTALGHDDRCDAFHFCIGGQAELQHCPHGQYFDRRISTCLPDLAGVCLGTPNTSPAETVIQDACQYYGNEGSLFRPHPADCGKFFFCLNGRAIIKECGKGLYYDKEQKHCRLDVAHKCIPSINELPVGSEQTEEIIVLKELSSPTQNSNHKQGVSKPKKKHQKQKLQQTSEHIVEAAQGSEKETEPPLREAAKPHPAALAAYEKLASKFILI